MNKETWSRALASVRAIRAWQVIVLVVILLGAGAGTYLAYSFLTVSDSVRLEEDQQLIPVQRGDLVKEVSISGTVSFPNRETLTFGSSGIVDDVLVEEGERVVEGQTLATLDADTIAGLEEAAAKARVDLRDAEDALADYLEPPSDLKIAEARHKVAQAELSLQNANEALDKILEPTAVEAADAEAKISRLLLDLQDAEDKLEDLIDPPVSLLDLEKAQIDVEAAQLSIEVARDNLEALFEPVSGQDIARAESRIESARVSLEKAKDDLEALFESADDQDVSQAQTAIERAKLNVRKAEEALAELMEPADPLAVSKAEDSIANMDLAVESAREALAELLAEPSPEDVEDANVAIERAASDLPLLREELEVARRDREIKLEEVQHRVDDAAEAYALKFLEWLGIEVDAESVDPDYEAALAALGVDLATLFDPSNQLPENPLIGVHKESTPSNDPSTPWNEFTVYAWLNLHFAPIVGVCEPDEIPTRGHCVQDEFRKTGEAYQAAIDNFESVDSQLARMIAEKESAEQRAQDALDKAQEALDDLMEPPDALAVTRHESDIATAELNAENARQALEDLLAPPDATAVADREMDITLAKESLANAEQALEDLFTPAEALAIESREAAVEAAELDLVDAEQALADLMESPDEQEVEKRNLDIAQAQIELRSAEERLADLVETVDETAVANQRMQIALIRANIAQAEDDLAELKSGEDRPGYDERSQDIDTAQLALEQRREELADLEGQTTEQVDVDFLEAAISAARAAVEQADRRLADSTLEAPWDGFVSQVNVEQGQQVGANASVLELVDTNVIEIDGSVDEIDVLSVVVGTEASVTMDALPGQSLPGLVSFLGAEAQSQQGIVSYPIGVQLQPPDDVALPEGLSAVATITIGQDLDVLLVPIQAVRGSFDQPTLGVMRDGEIAETPVTLGNSDDFWTVVTDGVAEGDQIVMTTQVDENEFGGFGPRRGSGVQIRRVVR